MARKLIIRAILLLIWPTVVYSCNLDSARLAEVNREYKEDLNVFDKKFVKHFPNKIMNLPTSSRISENTRSSHPGFWLKLYYSSDTINNIINNAQKRSKAIYSADDSCLLLIDKHLDGDNWVKYDKALRMGPKVEGIDKPCHRGKLPVPKFWKKWWKEIDKTEIGLDPAYKLYVLEAKSGVYMDEEKLPNGKYTPKGWEHGYSKGIAINKNKNTVIYWFDIW